MSVVTTPQEAWTFTIGQLTLRCENQGFPPLDKHQLPSKEIRQLNKSELETIEQRIIQCFTEGAPTAFVIENFLQGRANLVYDTHRVGRFFIAEELVFSGLMGAIENVLTESPQTIQSTGKKLKNIKAHLQKKAVIDLIRRCLSLFVIRTNFYNKRFANIMCKITALKPKKLKRERFSLIFFLYKVAICPRIFNDVRCYWSPFLTFLRYRLQAYGNCFSFPFSEGHPHLYEMRDVQFYSENRTKEADLSPQDKIEAQMMAAQHFPPYDQRGLKHADPFESQSTKFIQNFYDDRTNHHHPIALLIEALIATADESVATVCKEGSFLGLHVLARASMVVCFLTSGKQTLGPALSGLYNHAQKLSAGRQSCFLEPFFTSIYKKIAAKFKQKHWPIPSKEDYVKQALAFDEKRKGYFKNLKVNSHEIRKIIERLPEIAIDGHGDWEPWKNALFYYPEGLIVMLKKVVELPDWQKQSQISTIKSYPKIYRKLVDLFKELFTKFPTQEAHFSGIIYFINLLIKTQQIEMVKEMSEFLPFGGIYALLDYAFRVRDPLTVSRLIDLAMEKKLHNTVDAEKLFLVILGKIFRDLPEEHASFEEEKSKYAVKQFSSEFACLRWMSQPLHAIGPNLRQEGFWDFFYLGPKKQAIESIKKLLNKVMPKFNNLENNLREFFIELKGLFQQDSPVDYVRRPLPSASYKKICTIVEMTDQNERKLAPASEQKGNGNSSLSDNDSRESSSHRKRKDSRRLNRTRSSKRIAKLNAGH